MQWSVQGKTSFSIYRDSVIEAHGLRNCWSLNFSLTATRLGINDNTEDDKVSKIFWAFYEIHLSAKLFSTTCLLPFLVSSRVTGVSIGSHEVDVDQRIPKGFSVLLNTLNPLYHKIINLNFCRVITSEIWFTCTYICLCDPVSFNKN